MNPKEQHHQLCREINKHNYLYYTLNKPEISDAQYDKLFDQLLELERQYPELVTSFSPSQRVGSQTDSKLKTVKHSTPLLSLEKAQTEEDLRNFLNKFKRSAFIVQPKLDGLTIKDVFQYGYRQVSATRGNGEEGEDVTHSVNNIENVPKQITYSGYLEIRGEAIIPVQKFSEIQGEYKTPRNLVAGTVRALDGKLSKERGVEVLYYDLGENEELGFVNDLEALEFLKEKGFPLVEYKVFHNIDELIEYCLNFDRSNYPYEIDGLVIKIADYKTRKKVGSTAHHPRWAIAYKFPAQEKETTLKEVIWQVGRTGTVNPVLIFDEVQIGGVSITRCSGFNLDFISQFKIGDKILIKRSNDVIPYAIPQPEKRIGNEKDITIPSKCPICGHTTEIKTVNVPFLYCTNEQCNSKQIEKVLHFAKRDCMDIEGLGEVVATELVNRKLIKDVTDIFKLTKKDLSQLPLFKTKKINNLLKAIEQSKGRGLNQVIFALGIPGVGKETAKILASEFKSLEKLMKATEDELVFISGIGVKTASDIIDYFSDNRNIEIVTKLKKYGITTEMEIKNDLVSNKLKDKIFVITGTLSKPRDEFINIIESHGGRVTGSISKKTNFLLAGENVGATKTSKAEQCGTQVISEDEFWSMLNHG